MNEQNETNNNGDAQQQQYPNSQQQYPNSQQYPYSQQQYPNSQQYPYSQQQYPYSQVSYQAPPKKKNIWLPIAIAAIAAAVIVLVVILVLALRQRPNPQMNPQPMPMNQQVESGSVILNGQTVTFDVINKDSKTYLPVEDLFEQMGYTCSIDGKTIKITSDMETATLEVGSKTVKVNDTISGVATTVDITTEPFEQSGKVYIYARDLSLFMKNISVSYNSMQEYVEINSGGNMGVPPGGGMGGGQQPMNQQQGGGQIPENGQQPQQ